MIVFVDFDGVLHPVGGPLFSCVENFFAILRVHPSAQVVITSTWRDDYSLSALGEMLSNGGEFEGRVIGVTPNLESDGFYGRRDLEILQWMEVNRYGGRWLAIDDQAELFGGGHQNLYLVDGARGLADVDTVAIGYVIGSCD